MSEQNILTIDGLTQMAKLTGVWNDMGNGIVIASFDMIPEADLIRYDRICEAHYQTEEPALSLYKQALRGSKVLFILKYEDEIVVGGIMVNNNVKTHPHTGQLIPNVGVTTLFVDPNYRRRGIATELMDTFTTNAEWCAEQVGYSEATLRVIFETETTALGFWEPYIAGLLIGNWSAGTESIYSFNEVDVVDGEDISVTVVTPIDWVLPGDIEIKSSLISPKVYQWPEQGYDFPEDVEWFHPQGPEGVLDFVKVAMNMPPEQLPEFDTPIIFQKQAQRVEIVFDGDWELELID